MSFKKYVTKELIQLYYKRRNLMARYYHWSQKQGDDAKNKVKDILAQEKALRLQIEEMTRTPMRTFGRWQE